MRFSRFRTDPVFDDFVWLAPMHSLGAIALLAPPVSLLHALATGEAITAYGALLNGLVVIPMLGLPLAAMNMVAAYLPSVMAWHLTLRLTLGRLGRQGAVRAAATATAVTASLILAAWASLLLPDQDPSRVFLKGVAVIMLVSVIASIWTAEGIERKRRC